jgi:predicted protein tyrosine phosphatase
MEKREIDILVFNQEDVEEFMTDRPHVVISIKEPGPAKRAVFPENSYRIAELYLDFCDMDALRSPNVKNLPDVYKLFCEDDARSILKFLELMLPYINLIVVNCPGGISRSSAVAAAIAKILGQSDERFFNPKGPYTPNRFIYRTLLNVAMDSRPIGE